MTTTRNIAQALAGPPIGPLFGEDMTKSSIARRRKMAEALIGQATEYQPIYHWSQALAKALQGAVGGYTARQADAADSERSKAMASLLAGNDTAGLERAAIAYDAPELMTIAGARERRAERAADLDYRKSRDAADDAYRNSRAAAEDAYRNR